jgi:hypothetical protein
MTEECNRWTNHSMNRWINTNFHPAMVCVVLRIYRFQIYSHTEILWVTTYKYKGILCVECILPYKAHTLVNRFKGNNVYRLAFAMVIGM